MGGLSKFWEIANQAWDFVKKQIPAIVMSIFSYLFGKLRQTELERDKLKLELEKVKAYDKIDQDNASRSDSDILDDAIRKGSEYKPDDSGSNESKN